MCLPQWGQRKVSFQLCRHIYTTLEYLYMLIRNHKWINQACMQHGRFESLASCVPLTEDPWWIILWRNGTNDLAFCTDHHSRSNLVCILLWTTYPAAGINRITAQGLKPTNNHWLIVSHEGHDPLQTGQHHVGTVTCLVSRRWDFFPPDFWEHNPYSCLIRYFHFPAYLTLIISCFLCYSNHILGCFIKAYYQKWEWYGDSVPLV